MKLTNLIRLHYLVVNVLALPSFRVKRMSSIPVGHGKVNTFLQNFLSFLFYFFLNYIHTPVCSQVDRWATSQKFPYYLNICLSPTYLTQ